MRISGRRETFLLPMGFGFICFLSLSVNSTPDHHTPVTNHRTSQNYSVKLSPELSFQVKLHAFLLWASIGFLMPVGILIIRTSKSNRVQCGRKPKILFYCHVVFQSLEAVKDGPNHNEKVECECIHQWLEMAGVLLATGAAVLSLKNFDNSFSNTHQRMGLVLYGLVLVLPLIGFFRPHRGMKLRSVWYTAHWLLGTAISIIGIINIYLGLHAYEKKATGRLRFWTILFTAQVVITAFIYLLQDRWDYIKKQGVILGDEQIAPSNQMMNSPAHRNLKELPSMP